MDDFIAPNSETIADAAARGLPLEAADIGAGVHIPITMIVRLATTVSGTADGTMADTMTPANSKTMGQMEGQKGESGGAKTAETMTPRGTLYSSK
ncbi:hypothetical protein HK102_001780 [Quaeritorhiza haematococci]|nr:hypothetical protein HK102_001780 [Quaeritorhiza haematococci]